MPLHLVAGLAGAGKSTIRNELIAQQMRAVGTDEDGYASFYHIETGKQIATEMSPAERTPEWSRQHAWRLSRPLLEDLAMQAESEPVFVCGVTTNDHELWDMFASVFALVVDMQTVQERLLSRTNNDYGKSPHELAHVLGWHANFRDQYESRGAIILDGTLPPKTNVAAMLEYVRTTNETLRTPVSQLST